MSDRKISNMKFLKSWKMLQQKLHKRFLMYLTVKA